MQQMVWESDLNFGKRQAFLCPGIDEDGVFGERPSKIQPIFRPDQQQVTGGRLQNVKKQQVPVNNQKCHICCKPCPTNSVLLCNNCDRGSCVSCTHRCSRCSETFCGFCCIANFDQAQDRYFCRDCIPEIECR
eukprot:gene3138-8213_t